ncbi:MAG: peptide deformylase [Desulfobulbaceae bacterium]|nr:peptide deformylase [Desulfobulbaceae bacterium]
MTIRKIFTYPDPILRKKAEKITAFDDKLEQLAADMAETMYDAPGVGLAANQIGIAEQIIVVDISEEEDARDYLTLINPVISNGEGSIVGDEGCLSVLDYSTNVKRFEKIHVDAQNIKGEVLSFEAEKRFARIIQHEVDHLLGVLFIDRISSLKRGLYKKKLAKLLKK